MIAWKRTTPMSTTDLNQFIAIKFITRIHGIPQHQPNPSKLHIIRNQLSTQSIIQIWVSKESKLGQIKNIIEEQHGGSHAKNEMLYMELDVSNKYDFMDGYLQQVILEYT
jgi:hypothetical protein